MSLPWKLERTTRLAGKLLSAEDVRQFYERHGPALVAYACSFVADAAAAEDAVHGVFVRLLQVSIAVPEQPIAYLYRAVRNTALNVRRKGARSCPLDDAADCFVHRGGNREAAFALQQALSELPEDQRAVVIMRTWSGMTLEEVAAATDVPLHTAASRYRYALEKLRARLAPYRRVAEEEK